MIKRQNKWINGKKQNEWINEKISKIFYVQTLH